MPGGTNVRTIRFFQGNALSTRKICGSQGKSKLFCETDAFFSPYYFIMLWLFLKNYREIVRMEHELIDPFWKHCSDFSSKIKKRAEKSACCGKNKDHL